MPDDGRDMVAFQEWVDLRKAWYSKYGVKADRLRFYELTSEERPHYAKAGIDVEYLFPWGWGELESIAHRGAYDLDAHMKLSGKDLRYFDEANKAHYTPLLIESSAGMDRTTLTMLIDAMEHERGVDPNGKETDRTVLRFHPFIAPVQVAVFSLARNKPELVELRARSNSALRPKHRTQYDEGNIGQLYRRQDEIGTPFCVTVDYDTLTDGTVTVRERASMRQRTRPRQPARSLSRGAPVTMAVQAGTKRIFFFEEGNASMLDLLGGKGSGLAEMTAAKLPVPPGFTISTQACWSS